LKEVCILFNEGVPFGRHLFDKKDGRDRANRLTGGAIGADSRVYIHLLLGGASLYTINWTNINAKEFFGANAGFTNYKCQT
jgi:hypothetical protein